MNITLKTEIPLSHKTTGKIVNIPAHCFTITRSCQVALKPHKLIVGEYPQDVKIWREAEKAIESWQRGQGFKGKMQWSKKDASWQSGVACSSSFSVGGVFSEWLTKCRKFRDNEIWQCTLKDAPSLVLDSADMPLIRAAFGMKSNPKEGIPSTTAEDFLAAIAVLDFPAWSIREAAGKVDASFSLTTGWTLTLKKPAPTLPTVGNTESRRKQPADLLECGEKVEIEIPPFDKQRQAEIMAAAESKRLAEKAANRILSEMENEKRKKEKLIILSQGPGAEKLPLKRAKSTPAKSEKLRQAAV